MRWFLFVYIADADIQACLNGIILLGNPAAKNAAHVTVGGPYLTVNEAERVQGRIEGVRELVVKHRLRVREAGNFFDQEQNTVFLSCDSEVLRKYWDKKDYGYNPHITLYDGNERAFAKRLFETLSSQKINFSCKIGDIVLRRTGSGQIDDALTMNYAKINEMAGTKIDRDFIKKLPLWRRLTVIERLCAKLTVLSLDDRRREWQGKGGDPTFWSSTLGKRIGS